jgi:glucokinase
VILAGDVGGTKAMLLLAAARRGRMEPVFERRYAVASFPGFSALLAQFLDEYRQQRGRKPRLARACFGAAAGDHALAVSARGGVYIAGGIAPKILSRIAAGGFMEAFNAKGAHAPMNRRMPVRVVTTERLGLLGAALIAARG